MKSIKGDNKPSWRDPIKGGTQIYGCPQCEARGYPVASNQMLVKVSAEIEKGGKILVDDIDNAVCAQCGFELGEAVGKLVVDKVGLI